MKKRSLIAALLAITIASPAYAGFDEGVSAFLAHNYEEAIMHWMPLAEAEDTDAQYNLGCMFAKGIGVKQDIELAKVWHRKAAASGDVSAWQWLSHHEVDGFQGLPPFKDRMSTRFRYSMRLKLNNGHPMEWYCVTEDLDGANVYFRTGFMFDKGGMGVSQDYTEAVKWYERATTKGNAGAAKTMLAYLYVDGKGVERDLDRAGQLFLQAASEGEARAQAIAGGMFWKGWGGVSVNLPVAYVLYSHAMRGIDTQTRDLALPAMASLKAQMSPEELGRGEELDRQWTLGDPPPPGLLPK